MRLGFIGTGKITASVITGICTSKISFQKILISRRNKNISKKLKKRFRKVYIAKNNQEIVDKCNWIFLAVTPKVGNGNTYTLVVLSYIDNCVEVISTSFKLCCSYLCMMYFT